MTVVIGIYCKDGIVIAADSALTIGSLIEQPYPKKIADISADGLLTGFAGDLGFAQRFRQVAKNIWEDPNKAQLQTYELINEFSAGGVQEFYRTHTSNLALNVPTSFLVGFVHQNEHHLISLNSGTFQPTVINNNFWYCSLGSGATITIPLSGFIRKVFWKDGPPSLQDGIFAAVMCLQLAVEINAGGVNGDTHIGVIEKDEEGYITRKLSVDEVSGHIDAQKAALDYFSKFPEEFSKIRKEVSIPKPNKEDEAPQIKEASG